MIYGYTFGALLSNKYFIFIFSWITKYIFYLRVGSLRTCRPTFPTRSVGELPLNSRVFWPLFSYARLYFLPDPQCFSPKSVPTTPSPPPRRLYWLARKVLIKFSIWIRLTRFRSSHIWTALFVASLPSNTCLTGTSNPNTRTFWTGALPSDTTSTPCTSNTFPRKRRY